MKHLSFYPVTSVDELTFPETPQSIDVFMSALLVFNDFEVNQPMVIDASTSADDAVKIMQKSHVTMKIVVDHNKHFLGLVNLEMLNSQQIMKKINQGQDRANLMVTDFMKHKHELMAFDYQELSKASIQDVIYSLKNSGHRLCLVVDHKTHKIRGIISASDIARTLRLPSYTLLDVSFYNLYQELFSQKAS
ncbi:CBS domain-containing protein [Thalassotalea mangrovi]|uniref:CBS domain-containing protein n=1 Tax=Thalassotalea mangrovi TaxID=2572245 RepID=A0A4U1B6W3_9GAMM|nr:CBS domain-containing protein [Thalassotalea mangrovi]TKB45927.1 CBS domain-containing protein [Thalassotalea mangrovi]